MSFNGAGLFSINTSGQPVANGTTIDATVFNTLTADIATGLSTCVTKDGQTVIAANLPMAGFKFTGLGIGTAATDAARVDNANARSLCEGRLTLTTGVPVTTADVLAAETLFWSPIGGNAIALYDGTNWLRRVTAEISIDVPDATNCYDVFIFDNAGTPTLELTAWTDPTNRATALTLQDGVLVKTGVLTRRYVGTFYSTTAGNGQIEDSFAKRNLWNYYNRVLRPMRVETTNGLWVYTTATVRQAEGIATNQLEMVIGYSEDVVRARVMNSARNTSTGVVIVTGIGLDTTSAFTTAGQLLQVTETQVANLPAGMAATYEGFPGLGRHLFCWNEFSAATGTTTWIGTGSGGISRAGIHGTLWG